VRALQIRIRAAAGQPNLPLTPYSAIFYPQLLSIRALQKNTDMEVMMT
jgi:hypothetical protein